MNELEGLSERQKKIYEAMTLKQAERLIATGGNATREKLRIALIYVYRLCGGLRF